MKLFRLYEIVTMIYARIIALIFLSLALGSCSSAQTIYQHGEEIVESTIEAANEIQEIQIPINNNMSISKDGVTVSNDIIISPTRFRPVVSGVRYPVYYGVTIKVRF